MLLDNLLLNIFTITIAILAIFGINYLLKGKHLTWNAGLLASLAAILCISLPLALFSGQRFDLGGIVLLLGILYGGYGSGIIVTAITFLYRYILGDFGFIQTLITYLPISAIAFYLIPRFRNYSSMKKTVVTVMLDVAILVGNIVFMLFQYHLSRALLQELIEWALISAVGTILMVSLIEAIIHYILTASQLHELEKSQLVSHLTSSFAHEIRTPMTVIRGFIQLMREMVADDKQLHYINMVLSELDRADTIIEDYLSLSKPQIEAWERIEVAEILAHALTTVSTYAMLRNVAIRKQFEPSLYILVDRKKFLQATINILKNGIESMPAGGTLTIAAHQKKHLVTIDISDTGTGMTQEQIDRLGSPYYSTKSTGTGLGLMVTYHFIHLMKGKINVSSKMGKGTRFSILIPISDPYTGARCPEIF